MRGVRGLDGIVTESEFSAMPYTGAIASAGNP